MACAGLWYLINRRITWSSVRINLFDCGMNKVCNDDDNMTVYEEVLGMCVSCSTCDLQSQDDHCYTCRALGIIPSGTTPSPVRQDIEVPGDQGDKDRGSSKDVVKINNEIDNTDGIDNTHGLPIGLALGGVCGGVFTLTLVVGVTLLKKRRNGLVPVQQHDDAAVGQSTHLPPQQETNPPDKFHPSAALTNTEGFNQNSGLLEITL
ncbi:uncharacterized protein LOC117292535 isoform X2 [Asterias rubens]|uniref:uncharacterized protein LOC117292535 isoform X2 n=1 Tax=Asterias rubens TaxID=7604 RepID=UPI00145545DC|nr:uncharacterized protein LOC117292535 isoform X2 [Asterias rubens]